MALMLQPFKRKTASRTGENPISSWSFILLFLLNILIAFHSSPLFAFKAPSISDVPESITVKDKTVTLRDLKNPFRDDPSNLEKHVQEGGEIYFKHCFLCHGDLLNGRGVFGESLFPPPADFIAPGSTASKPEYYAFWRIAKGGRGLPASYETGNSAMPAWEDTLSEDEIWQVILYIFETSQEKFEKDISSKPSLERGKIVYDKKCAFCHGKTGDGKGISEPYSSPKPRNFIKGHLKIRSTPFGKIPTDKDIFNAISNGLPGASMPPWKHLPEVDRWSLVKYIKTFSKKFAKFKKKGKTHKLVSVPAVPPFTLESIVSGKDLFIKNCSGCHGAKGRGDGESIHRIVNIEKDNLFPRNLTKSWLFRRGSSRQDLYTTLRTGLSLTSMPMLSTKIFSDSQIWDIVNFVQTLSPASRPEIKKTLVVEKIEGNIPTDPDSKFWKSINQYYYPLAGQVIQFPKAYYPTVNSIYIQAVYNNEEIAFRIVWDDQTVDPILRISGKVEESPPPPLPPELAVEPGEEFPEPKPEPQKFPDSIALQFPLSYRANNVKPYFLNGDKTNPVNLWKWNSYPKGTVNLIARGIDQIKSLPDLNQNLQSSFGFKYGQYRVVLKRKLNNAEKGREVQFIAGEPIPIAFNVWDGSQGEHGTKKAISSWFEMILK